MTTSLPRLTAAALLLLGGTIVALSALGIAAARIAIAAGLSVSLTPADAALLDDLAQIVPFIGAFAAANIVAGVALISGSTWADRLATTVSAVAVGFGLLGMTLLILGNDPFTSLASNRALGGLQILGTFTALYGAVIVALALDGKSVVRVSNAAAA